MSDGQSITKNKSGGFAMIECLWTWEDDVIKDLRQSILDDSKAAWVRIRAPLSINASCPATDFLDRVDSRLRKRRLALPKTAPRASGSGPLTLPEAAKSPLASVAGAP